MTPRDLTPSARFGRSWPSPRAHYGCDKHEECESEPWPSPPYNPKQPKRCITHRQDMQTKMSANRSWRD
jgi:hypothetical protein